ncbi:hypothetical protein IAQ61_008838 [Plenodomus lingam]|uniref:uncharacterized protein n=1 Tax=Leptosphaeria maculans TaxID=5022 RepID=UPI0033337ED0|nr:hypothetical protein IAQ61_008838 [Plenodomus lingam]
MQAQSRGTAYNNIDIPAVETDVSINNMHSVQNQFNLSFAQFAATISFLQVSGNCNIIAPISRFKAAAVPTSPPSLTIMGYMQSMASLYMRSLLYLFAAGVMCSDMNSYDNISFNPTNYVLFLRNSSDHPGHVSSM